MKEIPTFTIQPINTLKSPSQASISMKEIRTPMARFRRCGETAVQKKPLVEAMRGNYSWDQSVVALAHSRDP
ncbi:hypothetical protein ERO13_A10G080100v2 [Gossypium hirsutum]|uniref:Uncharacterized protein n=4 Tax=Gossypium TaxID=3633 RepID=A0A5J5U451_GOSBA|nr:hypothetical protein ES319_A10G084500v1 [Gossypium barbadense]KAG4179014.1 hypothetical protein ERO13_A10G080100v2 [Gossypium hirsutum]TYG98129.1 hypothetical protein ES288_A10G092800v1 [Gossypium darwinii]TYI05491.1 hypothetical protein ES332_A10G091800v1 [Gossypium tomentosum]TYJ13997.1 hypothetical protein E1A91_A10G088300v1 [Gossypium mustelinum]